MEQWCRFILIYIVLLFLVVRYCPLLSLPGNSFLRHEVMQMCYSTIYFHILKD